ncbi:MAG: hypothetical protein ABL984_10745 [Pyrinomonadaceae bacterium]
MNRKNVVQLFFGRFPNLLNMATLGNLSRRTTALLYLVVASIVIGLFIYLEQIAILYVLSTLGIVALLLVVAFADLEHIGRDTN